MAFLHGDDAARAFEAALSFVDEYPFYEGDPETPPHSAEREGARKTRDSTTGSSVVETDDKKQRRARVNAKKRLLRKAGLYDDPNRARKERKLEIMFLRRKLEQLQLELQTMQVRRGKNTQVQAEEKTQDGANERAIVARRPNVEVSSAWREVANRQREQRDKSERENIRLRLTLERQHKLAEAMETLVQARIKQQMAEFSALSNPKVSRCVMGRTLDFRADIANFRDLLEDLDTAHREVDLVFASNRLDTTESSHHGVQLRSSKGIKRVHLEAFCNKALPFELRTTAEATWDHFKGMKKHGGNGNLYEKAAKNLETPYTIIEDYAKELFANTARADVRVKQIVRRYVEADREIVILVASVSPISISHKPLAGLTFNYRCYALIKRAAASTDDYDLSLLQLCTLASLKDEGTIDDPTYMRALSNFVLSNTAGNIKADQELIENVLVDQALFFELTAMAFLQDDDSAQTFEAALSFLDEYPLDDPLAGAPSISPQVSTETTLRCRNDRRSATARCKASMLLDSNEAKTKQTLINERKKLLRRAGVYGDPNRARNARRLEVAYLREQLEKLQIDLQTLQSKKSRCQAPTGADESRADPLTTMNEVAQIPSMWQTIAERQRHRREEVELENVRLKLAVDRQRKVADNLSSLMRKRASQLASECSSFAILNCPKPSIVCVMDFHGDIGEFQELFRRTDAAIKEVDAVFTANGLADMVVSPSDVHIRDGVGGKYLELFANKVLPFGLRDATEAAWDHFKGTKKHSSNGNIYEKSAKNLDEPFTIVETFTKEMYSNNSRADIKVKQVVRRFVQHDRDVVIWISRVSPAEIKHKVLRGLTYNLRGYALTKRSSASTPGREVTQLQFCSLFSLDQESGRTDKSRHVPKSMPQTERFNAPRTLVSIKDKRNQRDEVNAKKKLLRKAGIYGDSNRVRNERKLEIAYLRERIEKLQIDLKTLQTQKISNGATSPGKQQIADRQQRRRKEAERENIRLKLVVERQRKVANTMSSLLQKRANQMVLKGMNALALQVWAAESTTLYTCWMSVGRRMLVTPSDVHIRKNVGGKYLEVFSNKVVPFPLCTTAEAVWGHFKGTDKHMGNGSLYEKTAKDLDEPYTIIENFTKEVFSNNARADVKMKQVVRRFVEKDRDIVIWVASVAPIEIKHKMLRGLTYHLRGYALTKRSTVSIPGCELSQLHILVSSVVFGFLQ
ncbi:hypothetical protein BBO99_00000869 [Phytophthora kernoviae]|uniref:Uncharacterized protein n=1 Tax=Phytophthora kernoviae TaxID=325452 RepID=A0A3R7K3J8_9STRA|nr:hypothetical protein BBO99_00000869 [Phytophthora kernoviae]